MSDHGTDGANTILTLKWKPVNACQKESGKGNVVQLVDAMSQGNLWLDQKGQKCKKGYLLTAEY